MSRNPENTQMTNSNTGISEDRVIQDRGIPLNHLDEEISLGTAMGDEKNAIALSNNLEDIIDKIMHEKEYVNKMYVVFLIGSNTILTITGQ